MRQDADDFLPLKPVLFEILLSLAAQDRHGYGIVQDIAERTNPRMALDPGNLYKSIRTLLDSGLIEESDRRPAADLDDARRRYYRITPLGRRVAVAEAARLRHQLAQARKLIKARH
jgi:DNA-binding PadR family transcriptional regulator